MSTDNLIKMANQIAQYFASQPDQGAGGTQCTASSADLLGAGDAPAAEQAIDRGQCRGGVGPEGAGSVGLTGSISKTCAVLVGAALCRERAA